MVNSGFEMFTPFTLPSPSDKIEWTFNETVYLKIEYNCITSKYQKNNFNGGTCG